MPGLAKRRVPPSSALSMAAETLIFLRKTRFLVPGASRMSNPCSRSQVIASSYVRFSVVVAISHLSRVRFLTQTHCCPESRPTDTLAHPARFQQHYCCAKNYPLLVVFKQQSGGAAGVDVYVLTRNSGEIFN